MCSFLRLIGSRESRATDMPNPRTRLQGTNVLGTDAAGIPEALALAQVGLHSQLPRRHVMQ